MNNNNERYRGLRVVASTLKVVGWVVGVVGFVLVLWVSIHGSDIYNRLLLLIGGLLWVAVTAGVLLALSGITHLLIDVARDIKRNADK